MSKSTIDVERTLLEKLKKLKADNGLKTTSDAVKLLLDHYSGRGQVVASDDDEGDDSGEPEKRRKINVMPPLYSLNIMEERHEMVEYYTGFDVPTVELLIRQFSEVSQRFAFFPLFSFCRPACRPSRFCASSRCL